MSANAAASFASSLLPQLPLGKFGLVLIAVVASGAFTLGAFSFYGWEFLIYWPLLGAVRILYAFIALWGAILESQLWKWTARAPDVKGAGRRSQFWFGAAVLAASLAVWGLAHGKYLCLIVAGSPLPFVIIVSLMLCQHPIIRSLRNAKRDGAAFIALLILEAVLTFLIGEAMAADSFRKALQHVRRGDAAVGFISASDDADFVVDDAQKALVLKVRRGAPRAPFELRRPFAYFDCH